jgi:DNA-binding MarR family transcriptional regulator
MNDLSRVKILRMQKLDTFELIERINTLLRAKIRKKYTAIGLQPIHIQVLDYLSKCNQHSNTPAAVTDFLRQTKGTVSKSIQILQRKGYIKKITDVNDGRIIHLHLSDTGEKLIAEWQSLDDLAQTDVQNPSLNKALESILSNLQKTDNIKSFGYCYSCHDCYKIDERYYCQLADKSLTHADANKICKNHSVNY